MYNINNIYQNKIILLCENSFVAIKNLIKEGEIINGI
jgi:hypothetical protein